MGAAVREVHAQEHCLILAHTFSGGNDQQVAEPGGPCCLQLGCQADVVLWPEQLHHEVEVLTLLQLLGTLGPMPVVCLVPMELLFAWGFLCWLRAGLSCLSIVPSILQPQDSSMEHCKALPSLEPASPL